MHDAALVCGLERVGDLSRDAQRFLDRDRPCDDPLVECRPLDELHRERGRAVAALEAIDVRDVRMIERGQHFRFALKPRETISVVGERRRQSLEGDVAL